MAVRYTVHPLPPDFEPTAINDAGFIVGARRDRAVLYRAGRFTVLPGHLRDRSQVSRDSALGISSDGRIAGIVGWHYGEPFVIPSQATLWQNGRRFAAPTVENYSHGVFVAVNRRGEAAGWAGTATMSEDRDASHEAEQLGVTTQQSKAIYWDGKTMKVVGWGGLNAINDSGGTVGGVDGNAVFRPNAGAAWVKICPGVAHGISPKGLVCGDRAAGDSKRVQSRTTTNGKMTIEYFPLWRAFLWQVGKMTELPPLPDYDDSHANAINDAGIAVGSCQKGDDVHTATLWQDARPTDLNTVAHVSGRTLADAFAINAGGQILCKATDKKFRETYCLLVPQKTSAS